MGRDGSGLRIPRALGAVITMVLFAPVTLLGGQQPGRSWSPARTVDGHPDIQGMWTNFDRTPLEAPSAEAWKDLDALALWFPGINRPNGSLTGPNPSPAFSGETSAERSEARREEERGPVVSYDAWYPGQCSTSGE